MTHTKTDPRRHLVPAMYNWLIENYLRVYVSAVANHPKICIPTNIATKNARCTIDVIDDKGEEGLSTLEVKVVVLDFGINAIHSYNADEHGLHAKMRFHGKSFDVFLPYSSIIGIYSPDDPTHRSVMAFTLHYGQENLALTNQEAISTGQKSPDAQTDIKRARPTLTVVK